VYKNLLEHNFEVLCWVAVPVYTKHLDWTMK